MISVRWMHHYSLFLRTSEATDLLNLSKNSAKYAWVLKVCTEAMMHTKAITHVPQIVTYVVVEKGTGHKGTSRRTKVTTTMMHAL